MQTDETHAREVTQADFDFAKEFADTWCDGSQSAAVALVGKLAKHRAAFAAPPAVEREEFDGAGFVYWNPDSGEEYAPNHPIDSGECVEAEKVRLSTPQEDALHAAYQEQWKKAQALATVSKTEIVPTLHPSDREAIASMDMEALAKCIHEARFDGPPSWPLEEETQRGQTYCYRIANAVHLHILALSGSLAPEGGESVREQAHCAGIAAAIQWLRNLDTAEKPATQGHSAVWIADQMERVLGALPVGEEKDWLADIIVRASNAEALWREAGSPGPDKCDRVPGSTLFGAMMAFRRLAKDMGATLPPIDKEARES